MTQEREIGEPAVRADRVTKSYRIYRSARDRLLEVLLRRRRHRPFDALRDVSFEVRPGEGLGIIGENGAGKSTLLRILSGITTPTSGRVETSGRVAGILELGSGFHGEFTGRQNALLNAALLGIGESEARARLPRILDFAELGSFADDPVRLWSTGMVMRLAFAVAIEVEPSVLVVDEALSVGDGHFQKKCLDRLADFAAAGNTLVFCSHSLYYVSEFCRRALWLHEGRVAALGPSHDVIHRYEQHLLGKKAAGEVPRTPDAGPGPARLAAVNLHGPGAAALGEPWGVEVEWESDDPKLQFHVAVGVDRGDGVQAFAFATHRDGVSPFTGSRRHVLRLTVPELPLLQGEFDVFVFLLDERGRHVFDQRHIRHAFRVAPQGYQIGLIAPAHRWEPLSR